MLWAQMAAFSTGCDGPHGKADNIDDAHARAPQKQDEADVEGEANRPTMLILHNHQKKRTDHCRISHVATYSKACEP